jgi:lipoyl(octanoyl) transferase
MACMSGELWVANLGTVEYSAAFAIQERLRDARQADEIPDVLLLLEHPPVYTRGRRTGEGELPMGEDWYAAQGIDIVDVDRGGRVTYHGPGQLVGYPIMSTSEVLGFVRTMESALVAALDDEGIAARTRPDEGADYTGVWVDDRKIASIGIRVSGGVTTHGFAVNVQNDLQPFEWVVPCGVAGVRMTSVMRETAATGEVIACFRKRAAYRFAQAHGLRQRLVSAQRLGIELPGRPAGRRLAIPSLP